MIKRPLPLQQDQRHRKNNSKIDINAQINHIENQTQMKFKQFNQYAHQYNNISSPKMSNNPSRYARKQSKFAQRNFEVNDDEQQRQKLLLQIGGYFSQSQNKSQIISIHQLEQYQPIMMSNINYNFKRNFRLLSYTKIKNNIEELRTMQTDVIDYLNEQKQSLTSQIQKMGEYLLKKVKVQNLPSAQLMQQIFEKNKTIASLESKIQQKDQQISRTKKELSNIKTIFERKGQQKDKQPIINNKKIAQRSNSNFQTPNCANCKILEIKYNTLRQQLGQLEQLKVQNQNLQQYIFDIEQQIVGIDIEVQRKVAEHMKVLDKLNANRLTTEPHQQSENYIQILRKLNDQNTSLQQKYERLQKNTIKQSQLTQFQKRLIQKQKDYQRKESQLFQSLAKHEKDKEYLYQREHYILISEQQISNKIQQLNQKQIQLNQWQSALINQIQLPNILPSIQHRENMQNQNYQIDETIVNSFGKIQTQYASRYDEDKSQLERNLSHNVFIPQLPMHKNQSHSYLQRNYERKLERQYPITNKHSPKSKNHQSRVYTEIIRKPQDKFHHYNNMKRKNQIQLNQKISHRDKSYQSKSPKNYREQYSKTKKTAANKDRNNYLPNYTSSNDKVGLRQNTVGLTDKLDRLREQIKRQIKSIV